jgi:hypothetical protein
LGGGDADGRKGKFGPILCARRGRPGRKRPQRASQREYWWVAHALTEVAIGAHFERRTADNHRADNVGEAPDVRTPAGSSAIARSRAPAELHA